MVQFKDKYKFIEVKSRSGRDYELPLSNGDTVLVRPDGQRKISTEFLGQVPDLTMVTFVKPDLAQLIKDGIIVTRPTTPAADGDEQDNTLTNTLTI